MAKGRDGKEHFDDSRLISSRFPILIVVWKLGKKPHFLFRNGVDPNFRLMQPPGYLT
jgi:hypothetical protein